VILVAGTIYSLLPPLVAIVLCVVLREAILALLAGIVVGSYLLYGLSPVMPLFRAFDEIMLASFTDTDNAIVLMFTVLTGGVTGILNGSAVARAFIKKLANQVQDRGKAMVTIWLTGFLFFIDDYANCLVVGNVYRGLADRLRISREKLAYLVDTTAAPITSLALVSTWIGVEVSLIREALEITGNTQETAYGLFLSSIPYRFYPVLALVFGLMIALSKRDFGPMYRVESAPQGDEELPVAVETPDSSERPLSSLASLVLLPLIVLLVSSIGLLAWHGHHNGATVDWVHPLDTLMGLFSQADPFLCLLWATILATITSFVVHYGILREPPLEIHRAWFSGCQGMFTVCVILVMAWSIGDVCKQLGTGPYVASLLGAGFPPAFLPFFTFLFAAVISFATGTSYGTMSILMPIALPIALQLGGGNHEIIVATVGSVLGGAIFGDHCSPLSDTTILSAGSSGCSITAHVNTQFPYALLVGGVSALCLLGIAVLPVSVYGYLVLAVAVLGGFLFHKGKKTDDADPVENRGVGDPVSN
jgi:Na+/H+ antiporter NhaC